MGWHVAKSVTNAEEIELMALDKLHPAEVAGQLSAAKRAAVLLLESGEAGVGGRFQVELHGQASKEHKAALDDCDDIIGVTIYRMR